MLSLSVVAVLGASAWWVTWPDRTARLFVEQMTSGHSDPPWIKMMVCPPGIGSVQAYDPYRALQPPKDWNDVEPQQRSFRDLIDAAGWFKISGDFGWDFTVERVRVIGPSEETCRAIIVARWREREMQELPRLMEQVRRFREQSRAQAESDNPEP
jgi:hypothetical protein